MSTPADDGDPRDVLGYLLKHAHLRLTRLTDDALAEHGVDSRDFGVLRVVAAGAPRSQAEIGQVLSLDRTTMVARIDALERQGVVARRPDPDDRRRNVVELTTAGRATFAAAQASYDAAERAFLTALSPASSARLRTALRAVVETEAETGADADVDLD